VFAHLIALLISSANVSADVGRLGPHGLQGSKLTNPDRWMAIVGDSGVTGAASSVNIEPTIANLLGLMVNFATEPRVQSEVPKLSEFPAPEKFQLSQIDPLTRVPYSTAEFIREGDFVNRWLLNMTSKLQLRLDVPEHAFGYLVGRGLGIKSSDIVLVGQDGVMVETIPAQFSRIYEMQTKTLPPLILLSFTANDLCDERVIDEPFAKWAGRFKANLGEAWIQAEPFLKAHPHGTHIVVLAPFDVVNVITNPEILAQTTNVEGQGQISCGQLRHGDTHFSVGAWFVMRMLNLMCPSVTQTHPEDADRLLRLRNLQQAFGEAWKEQINELNAQFGAKGLRWTYLENVRDLRLTTGDVGNDCFHPSVRGHAKLAELILQSQVLP
jgi:hypothetical protein